MTPTMSLRGGSSPTRQSSAVGAKDMDCFVASLLAMTGNLISLEFGVILDMLPTYPKGRQEFS
ncbi:MAG: hypothetical protein ACO4B0_14885 [bacterium]